MHQAVQRLDPGYKCPGFAGITRRALRIPSVETQWQIETGVPVDIVENSVSRSAVLCVDPCDDGAENGIASSDSMDQVHVGMCAVRAAKEALDRDAAHDIIRSEPKSILAGFRMVHQKHWRLVYSRTLSVDQPACERLPVLISDSALCSGRRGEG